MMLWRFTDPGDLSYASASRRGTWSGIPEQRVKPLLIEWEPDSNIIEDFTWPGFDSDLIVNDAVADAFKAANVSGFELADIEMLENSEPAKRKSRKPRVMLPYSGPRLWDLYVTARVGADRDRSTINEVTKASGRLTFELKGHEHVETVWNPERTELLKVVHKRVEGQGLFVRDAQGIFRIDECPAWVFGTNDVKELIEGHKFTNVAFRAMGEVL